MDAEGDVPQARACARPGFDGAEPRLVPAVFGDFRFGESILSTLR